MPVSRSTARPCWSFGQPLTLLLVFAIACGGGGDGIVRPRSQAALTGIALNPPSLTLQVTQTGQLQASLAGPGASSGQGTISFASSATSVATVSSTGLVTAISPGTATIIATGSHPTSGNLTTSTVSASSIVNVTARPVSTIALTLASSSLVVGQQTQATAVARDAAGGALPEATIAFASSNASVASISQAGLVTAIGPGTTLISATSGAAAQTATLTVTPAFVPVASIQPFSIPNIVGGSTRTLTVVPLDGSGTPLTDRVCTWTSSATQAATVTSPGMTSTLTVLSALASTTPVTITVTCEGRSASAAFSATPIPVAAVILTRDSTVLAHGESGLIRATLRDAQGNVLLNRAVVFMDTTGRLGLPPSGAWTTCAVEGQTCAFTGMRLVRYGASDQFTYRTVTGSVPCTNDAFGRDPATGIEKECAHAAPASSTNGQVLVSAWHCFDDICPRGISESVVRAVPVENPQGVAGLITQGVVPEFVLVARTPSDSGPLSVETTHTLAFSNDVSGTGLGNQHVGLRIVGSATLIDPFGAITVQQNVLTFPARLTENRRYEFFYTNALKDIYGKALRNPGAFTYTTVQMDKRYYYRLTSVFADAMGRSLSTAVGTIQCVMSPTNVDDPRQRWYVEPYEASQPGLDTRFPSATSRVRLRNQFYGDARNLEGATPGGSCQMNPAGPDRFGGEEWYSASYFGLAFYWLHAGNPAFALDQPGAGTIAGLAATGNFSGQAWSFTRLGRR